MKQMYLRNVLLLTLLFLTALPGYGLAITGTVFNDKNADGVMQASEEGIANTAISDGLQVVLTDSTGSYQLNTELSRFVFVSLPRGYKSTKSFYHTFDSGTSIDFPMSIWPESAANDIRFVQITDLHIKNNESAKVVIDDIAGAKTMNPKPAFVIATGDLVEDGKNIPEFESLMSAIPDISIPIFLGIGNHDVLGGNTNYQRFCGPRYYSFNAGNCHFVMLDCTQFDDKQKAWIESDLAAAPKDATRVFLMHYLPTRDHLRLFADFDAAAVLSGHWHGSRNTRTFGVLNLNTPPFRFAGIDRTPASFQVVDIRNGRVTSELRFTGQEKRAAIITPAGRVSAINGEIQVLVNAYDTWAGVNSIDCQIDGKSYTLIKKSPWSWTGRIPINPANPAVQYITAVIYGSNGKKWTTSSKFQLDRKANAVKTEADWAWHNSFLHQGVAAKAVRPPLKLAWASSTGGMIGLSSPMVSSGIVTVGVADANSLQNCGIAAFDAATGVSRWYFPTESAVKGSPAIADGKVFAISIAGNLYALDLRTGKIQWMKLLHRQIERWEVSSPAVADGVVYVGSQVYCAAYEANTGKLIWERSMQNSIDKNGNKLWDRTRFGPDDWVPTNYTVPTPIDDKVLVPTRGGLFALGKATGEPIWKTEGRSNVGAIENENNILYNVQNMVPTAIKLDSGELLWSSKEKLGDCTSSPALSNDRMVVGTGNGRVCAFSTKDGTRLWSFQTGKAIADTMPYVRGKSDINSSPVISGNTVYIGASDGYFYALSLETGEKLWSYYLGVPIASTPAISGNAIFIAGYDGNVYAFVGNN